MFGTRSCRQPKNSTFARSTGSPSATGTREHDHTRTRIAVDSGSFDVQRRGRQRSKNSRWVSPQRFVLVDQQGRIRGYYDEQEPERMSKLVTDVRRLVRWPGR